MPLNLVKKKTEENIGSIEDVSMIYIHNNRCTRKFTQKTDIFQNSPYLLSLLIRGKFSCLT